MVNIVNKTYPSSDQIPFSGGVIKVKDSDLVDDSDDYVLDTKSGTGIWSKASETGTVVNKSDGIWSFEGGGTDYITWETSQNYTLGTDIISSGLVYFLPKLTLGKNGVLLGVRNSGDRVSFTINVENISNNGTKLGLSIEYSHVDNSVSKSSEKAFDIKFDEKESIEPRIFINQYGEVSFGIKVGDRDFRYIFSTDSVDFDNSDFKLFLRIFSTADNTSSGVGNDLIDMSAYQFFPKLENLHCKNFSLQPIPITKNPDEGSVFYSVDPGYPGDFDDLTLRGSGPSRDTTEDLPNLTVNHETVDDRNVAFLDSYVQSFDSDLPPKAVCRQYAKKIDVEGDMKLKMRCIDDGTDSLNPNAPHDNDRLVINNDKTFAREPNNDIRSEDYPSFFFKEKVGQADSDITHFGENFDFQKIHANTENLVDVSAGHTIKRMRSLVLENGDRVYYGIVYKPYKGTVDYDFDLTVVSGESSADWELGYADYPKGANSVIDTGTDADVPFTKSLDSNRLYYFTVRKGNANITRSTNASAVNKIDDIKTAYDDGVGVNNETYSDGAKEHKLLFESKNPLGQPIVYYWDRSENNFYSYTDSKDICLRSDSIAAIETLDNNIALFYEKSDQIGFYANKENELTYKVVDIQNNNGFGAENKVNLPFTDSGVLERNENKFIHSFDVIRNNDDEVFFHLVTWDSSQSEILSPIIDDQMKIWKNNLSEDPNSEESISFKDGGTVNAHFTDQIVRSVDLTSLKRIYEQGQDYTSLGKERFIQTSHDFGSENEPDPNYIISKSGQKPHFIDCNYDSERDISICSVINYRHRAPIVYAGKKGSYDEVSVPRFFDMFSFGERGFSGYEEHEVNVDGNVDPESTIVVTGDNVGLNYPGLNSISSAFGSDGMIYSIAVKGKHIAEDFSNDITVPFVKRECEIGLIDSGFLKNNRKYFVDFDNPDIGSEMGVIAAFSDTEYSFETIPFANFYNGNENDGIKMASINSQNNYLFTCLGDNIKSKNKIWPSIFQSGHPDSVPTEVPFDSIWTNRYLSNGLIETNIDHSVTSRTDQTDNSSYYPNLSVGDTLPFMTLYNGYDNNGTNETSEVVHEIPTDVQSKLDFLARGMKISVSMSEVISSGDHFQDELILEYRIGDQIKISNEEKNSYDLAEVRVAYNGQEAQLRVKNYDTGNWEDKFTICDITDEIKEFTLIINFGKSQTRNVSETPPYDIGLVIKESDHYNGIVSRGTKVSEQYFSFNNRSIVKKAIGNVDTSSGTAPKSRVKISFSDTNIYDEIVEIRNISWSLSNMKKGVLAYPANDENDTFEDAKNRLPGKEWRSFRDDVIFGKQSFYPFRISAKNIGLKESSNYHFPNGFVLYFAGDKGVEDDEWVLNRKQIKNTDNLSKSKIHTFFTTENDDTLFRLWSDSKDFNTPRFDVDTLLVSGCNFPRFKVIGTNETDSNDEPINWKVLEIINTAKYFIPHSDSRLFDNINEKKSLEIDHANFQVGEFSNLQYYLSNTNKRFFANVDLNENFDRSLKLKDSVNRKNSNNDLLLADAAIINGSEANFDYFDKNLFVYSEKIMKKMDREYSFRFFGIEIPSFQTYEDKFLINSIDFGKRVDIPDKHSLPFDSGVNYEISAEVSYSFDEQAYYSNRKDLKKNINIQYRNISGSVFDILKEMIEELAVSRKPVWVLEDINKIDAFEKYFVNNDISYSNKINEDGERVYSMSFNMISAS